MPRSSSVLDGRRFGDEALRVQNLLQYIPRSRITQPNADSDCRIQTGQSQLLQVAETLSRLIRDADRCMNTNSPGTGPSSDQPVGPGMAQPCLCWAPSISTATITFDTRDRCPQWKGTIFVGGLVGAQLHRVVLNPTNGLPTRRQPMLAELKQRIREVKQGPVGLLYLLTDEEAGALFRIEPVD